MKAPFPWFGGKSSVADIVWQRFGNVPNYVEPFAGSLTVLLNRPHEGRTETINDKDCHLANFWRAVSRDPDAVAENSVHILTECDLEARRTWVFDHPDRDEFRARMYNDCEYYDAELAGWWVWGVCATIGGNWKPRSMHLGAGMGIHKPSMHLGNAGMGIHKPGMHLGNAGRGIKTWFSELCHRLRRVRVKCGDWTGVTSPTVTIHNGLTAVFLDPPYDSDCCTDVYGHNDSIGQAVRDWAVERGDEPQMRIALCGYEGEHDLPSNWECYKWKARGGYGSQHDGRGRENSARERIWFSPHCLRNELFDFNA